jgi:hypothetical protein
VIIYFALPFSLKTIEQQFISLGFYCTTQCAEYCKWVICKKYLKGLFHENEYFIGCLYVEKYDIKFLVLGKYLLIPNILPKPLFNEACSCFQMADFDTKICSESRLSL